MLTCSKCHKQLAQCVIDNTCIDQELFDKVAIAAFSGLIANNCGSLEDYTRQSFLYAQAFMSERSKYLKK